MSHLFAGIALSAASSCLLLVHMPEVNGSWSIATIVVGWYLLVLA